jgi:hypothetical protein
MAARRLSALQAISEKHVVYVFRDGDKWCAVHENFVDLQTSEAGFGDTQGLAIASLYGLVV